MIKTILNLFKRKKNSEEENLDIPNSISFSFHNNDNEISVKIIISKLDDKIAQQFGELLFHLNEGYYAQSIVETMNEISAQGTNELIFVKKITHSWAEKIIEADRLEETINQEPIVSPSYFKQMIDK